MDRDVRTERGGRLVLPADLIPEALRLGGGSAASRVGGPLLERLEAAGITVGGRLHPVAEQLFAILDDPYLIVRIVVDRPQRRCRATVWATPASAVVATSSSDDEYELTPARVGVLTFRIADICGVEAREAPFSGARLEDGSHDGLRRLVHDVAAHRFTVRSTWRQASVRDETVDMIDAGALGHWRVHDGGTLEALTTGEVLAAIAATLPPRDT